MGQVEGAWQRQASDGALQNKDTAKGGWQADALSPPQAAAAVAVVSACAVLPNTTCLLLDTTLHRTCQLWNCPVVLHLQLQFAAAWAFKFMSR